MAWGVTSTVASGAENQGYYDNSGFVVNMGGASTVPWYVWAGAAILALAWIKRKG